MDSFNIREYQDRVPPPQFDAEHVNKLQEWVCLSVQLFSATLLPRTISYKVSPEWTEAYNQSGFAYTEGRLFGADNYKFFIGRIQTLSGNQCKPDTQAFQIELQSTS
jgi:hypothetical protein